MPRLREFRWARWAEWGVHEIESDQPSIIAVDTETTGLEFYDEPFAATLSWRGRDGSLKRAYFDLEADDREHRIANLRYVLGQLVPTWVFHNAKFDLQKLMLIGGIDWGVLSRTTLHDTQTVFHLLDENSPKGLKKLAVSVLKWDDSVEVEIKSGPNKGQTKRVPREEHRLAAVRRKLKLTKDDGYHLLPREVLIPYALRDTDFTLLLFEKLMPRLEAKDEALQRLYRDSMRLKLALLRMESDGFALDLEYLARTASEYGVRTMQSWQRVVELTGKADLNPQSPAQLTAAFEARGVFLEDTQAATLEKLDDELAHAILEHRENQKLYKTYLVGLQRAQRAGIVHPNFNDDGARTGRMSSGSAKE